MSVPKVHLCCLLPADGDHATWCTELKAHEAETRQQRRARLREAAKDAQIKTTHQIDQAHAQALERIDGLVKHIRLWRSEPDEIEDQEDALNNSMVFFAITKMMEQQVDVRDLPYLLSAAILKIAQLDK